MVAEKIVGGLLGNIGTFISDESGASATEYAVMLVLILLVALATIVFMGEKVETAFNLFASQFGNQIN